MNGHRVLQKLILFRLLLLGYPAGFSVRRPTISVCKSTGPQRGNQKQMEGGHDWDSSKIHCTMKKRLNWVNKQNVGAIQHIFSLIAVTGYRSHAMRRVELIGYFVRFGPQYSFAYFTVKTKAYNVVIYHTVELWLLLRMLFLFVWILLLNSTTSLQSWGRFCEPSCIVNDTVTLARKQLSWYSHSSGPTSHLTCNRLLYLFLLTERSLLTLYTVEPHRHTDMLGEMVTVIPWDNKDTFLTDITPQEKIPPEVTAA